MPLVLNRPTAAALFVASLVVLLALVAGCAKRITNPGPVTPLEHLILSPDTLSIRIGGHGGFTATALDSSGNTVATAPIAFSSRDSLGAIITLTGSGRVTGISEGITTVIASSGGVSDTSVVVVGPASDGWFAQTSNASLAKLNGVFFLTDGRTGWAVGNGGKIVATDDAGAHWTVQLSHTALDLNAVWFVNALEGWAVGANGTVVHTLSGGIQWDIVIAGASEDLMGVCFSSAIDSLGWAVGTNGVTLRTHNRGHSWTKLNPTGSTLYGVAFSDTSNGWAVGDGGTILGTHNGGLSWFRVVPAVTPNSLRDVWRRSESRAYAVGGGGAAPRTVRLPADTTSWELRSAGTINQLEGVSFPSDSVGYAVGSNGAGGTIQRSADRGVTWASQSPNTSYTLNDVFFVDEQHGWAVGNGGVILHTATGGAP